jgi:hypothetical protein
MEVSGELHASAALPPRIEPSITIEQGTAAVVAETLTTDWKVQLPVSALYSLLVMYFCPSFLHSAVPLLCNV